MKRINPARMKAKKLKTN